jgi:hypothetical protein
MSERPGVIGRVSLVGFGSDAAADFRKALLA